MEVDPKTDISHQPGQAALSSMAPAKSNIKMAGPSSASNLPSKPCRNNEVSTVLLHGVAIVSLVIDAKERLCLAQISNTLLKDYSYNEIHNRRVALGVTCVQCTPVQLEILRRAGAMPVSSRRCGMITKREAERLVRSFLEDTTPPKLPEDFFFDVVHDCGWGCRGDFVPSRYNSSRAKCIKCSYCNVFFSPNKFIFHFHRLPDSKYNHPDAANFNSWRRHLKLTSERESPQMAHAWEDVKAMFNGGGRKRLISISPRSSSSSSHISTVDIYNNRLNKSRMHHSLPERPRSTHDQKHPVMQQQQLVSGYPPASILAAGNPTGLAQVARGYQDLQRSLQDMSTYSKLMPPDIMQTAYYNPYGCFVHPAYEHMVPGFKKCLHYTDKNQKMLVEQLVDNNNRKRNYAEYETTSERNDIQISRTPSPKRIRQTQVEHGQSDISNNNNRINNMNNNNESVNDNQNDPINARMSAFRPVAPNNFKTAFPNDTVAPDTRLTLSPHCRKTEFSNVSMNDSSNVVLNPTCMKRNISDFSIENLAKSDNRESRLRDMKKRVDSESTAHESGLEQEHALDDSGSDGNACNLALGDPDESTHSHQSDIAGHNVENANAETESTITESADSTSGGVDLTTTDKQREQLQLEIRFEREARQRIQSECQVIKDTFQEQIKQAVSYRDEIAKQLHIVRETLCSKIDQERTVRMTLQERLKEAHDVLQTYSRKMMSVPPPFVECFPKTS